MAAQFNSKTLWPLTSNLQTVLTCRLVQFSQLLRRRSVEPYLNRYNFFNEVIGHNVLSNQFAIALKLFYKEKVRYFIKCKIVRTTVCKSWLNSMLELSITAVRCQSGMYKCVM